MTQKKLGKFKTLKLIIILFICLFVILEIATIGYIHINNQKEISFTQISSKKPVDYTNKVYFSIQPTENWIGDEGLVYTIFDGTILNTKKSKFSDWKIHIKVPLNTEIHNFWNCSVIINEQTLIISPKIQDNDIINNNTETSFGFLLSSDKEITFRTATISGKMKQKTLYNKYFIILLTLIFISCAGLVALSIAYRFYSQRLESIRNQINMVNKLIEQTMRTFTSFIDNKDPYTRGHSARVAEYSREIAKRMNMSPDEQLYIYYAGLMHDIGKLTIKDEILNKTTRLSPDEWEIIKQHTVNGAELLKNFTILPVINDAVLYHHERYDGSGYINRLKGDAIPLVARIVCIADSYDAMSTNRCYRLKFSEERIVNELQRCAGKQFDPMIVPYLVEIIKDGTIYKL